MFTQPLSFPRVRHPALRSGLVLLLLAGAACSDELPLPTGADPGPAMTAVPSPGLAAETVPNSWTRRIQMPTARAGLVAAKVNGLIYAIGGWNSGTALQKVEAYDYNTNTLVPWTPRAPLPASRQFPNGAAVINGKIYVAGGLTALGPTRSLYVYNVAANSWSTMTPMPVRSYGGAAAAIDGKLWVVATTPGDSGRYIDPARIFRYDPATDSWSEREPAPHPHHLGTVGVINGKIYVAGGTAKTDFSDVSYQYDWAPVACAGRVRPGDQRLDPQAVDAHGALGRGRRRDRREALCRRRHGGRFQRPARPWRCTIRPPIPGHRERRC